MSAAKYKKIFALLIINLIAMIFFLPKDDLVLFVKEFYFMLLLLIFAGISIYGIANKIRHGLLMAAVLFAVFMLNAFYIYYTSSGSLLLFLFIIIAGAVGFTISVSAIEQSSVSYNRRKMKNKTSRSWQEHDMELKPIIVENMPPAKKEQGKTKKSTKKRKIAKTAKAKSSSAKKKKQSAGKKRPGSAKAKSSSAKKKKQSAGKKKL